MTDMLTFERGLVLQGAKHILGIDEAGRGPLAGPVVVAGVVMPLDDIIGGVDDSKKLSAKKRETLFKIITEKAIQMHVAVIDNQTVDEVNILNATKQGMAECVAKCQADAVLIDAVKLNTNLPTLSIIHGDALSYSIAAASIVAKVTRDRIMLDYDKVYPQYNFAKHKGYGTKEHIELLRKFGPCPIHRKTFIGHFVQ